MTSVLIDIDQLTEAVARRVVELLDERGQQPAVLVDHAILARSLGVSRLTVHERAQELGAVHLGDGSQPRLRFAPVKPHEAWTVRCSSAKSQLPRLHSHVPTVSVLGLTPSGGRRVRSSVPIALESRTAEAASASGQAERRVR